VRKEKELEMRMLLRLKRRCHYLAGKKENRFSHWNVIPIDY